MHIDVCKLLWVLKLLTRAVILKSKKILLKLNYHPVTFLVSADPHMCCE